MTLIEISALLGIIGSFTFAIFNFKTKQKLEYMRDELQLAGSNVAVANEKALHLQTQIEDLTQKLQETEVQALKNHTEAIQAQAESQKMHEILAAERKILNEAQNKLSDVFKSHASQALEGSNKQFLELAKQFFSRENESAKNDLSKRQVAIDSLIKPLSDTMQKYQVHLREIETARQRSYTTVENELQKVIETGAALSHETRALKNALKKPHIRGRWGEIQLKNCIELAGMSEFADVTFQDVNETNDGNKLIPDMTVKMPGGRQVIVDSKAPMEAFITALEADTEEERTTQTVRHGRHVKEHIKKLSSKAYQDNLTSSADFTVMFLPNESFLYAALESESDLVEYAMQKKILIATPPTFIGLLKVIRYGWNEEKLARNATDISAAGHELHNRLVDFVDALKNMGKHLQKAQEAYDTGFTRLNSRVLVQARKMESLGIKGKKELPENLGHENLLAIANDNNTSSVQPLSLEDNTNNVTTN